MDNQQRSEILKLLEGKYQYTKDSDPEKIIEYYEKNIIQPLKKRTTIGNKILLDVSSGFGWMVFAYIKQGGKFAYGVDIHKFSVESSKKIAKILKLDKKCKFSMGNIEKLKFKNKSIDIVSSLETLEHVKKQKLALEEIDRVAKNFVVITTPNGIFPKDIHDSGMLLGNYLPKFVRRVYIKITKKTDCLDAMTKVMTPFTIEHKLKNFKIVSKILSFDSFSEWLNSRPHYFPYGNGRNKYVPKINKKSLKYKIFRVAYLIFGAKIRYLLPDYCAVFQRKNTDQH